MTSFEQLIQNQLSGGNQEISELINLYAAHADDSQFEHFDAFCRFLFLSGHYQKLIEIFLRQAEKKGENLDSSSLPWLLLFESILRLESFIPSYIRSSLFDLMKELDLKPELARSERGRKAIPELQEEFDHLRDTSEENIKSLKHSLFEQARAYDIQNLTDLQKRTLSRIEKIDPTDSRIKTEKQRLIEKSALDVLSRKSMFHQRDILRDTSDDEFSEVAALVAKQLQGEQDPHEVAVVLATWGFPQLSLNMIESMAEPTVEGSWLKCDLLHELGRYAELLAFLYTIENSFTEDPETFFKTTYLRAQAFWGLGQKEKAIETMESLLTTKPQYRAGQTLLTLWRERLNE